MKILAKGQQSTDLIVPEKRAFRCSVALTFTDPSRSEAAGLFRFKQSTFALAGAYSDHSAFGLRVPQAGKSCQP